MIMCEYVNVSLFAFYKLATGRNIFLWNVNEQLAFFSK